MDSGFCVTKGLVKLRKKGLFGSAIIKKRRYWLANIKGNAIDSHFSQNEVGSVDAINNVEGGLDYRVFFMKDPYYVMNIMTTYGILETTDNRTRGKFKRSGVMETKQFVYTEVVANIYLF